MQNNKSIIRHQKQQLVSNLGGDSVGDIGLHGGHVLLWVVNGDKKVTGFYGVLRVCFQVTIQLQPVEQL